MSFMSYIPQMSQMMDIECNKYNVGVKKAFPKIVVDRIQIAVQ